LGGYSTHYKKVNFVNILPIAIKVICFRKFDANCNEFTLQYVLTLSLSNFEEDIRVVCSRATEEESIEKGLISLENDWKCEKIGIFNSGQDFIRFLPSDSILKKIDSSLDQLAAMEASK